MARKLNKNNDKMAKLENKSKSQKINIAFLFMKRRSRSKPPLASSAHCARHCLSCTRTRACPDSTRVSYPCGWGRFPTPWWSSPALSAPLSCSTREFLTHKIFCHYVNPCWGGFTATLFPSPVLTAPRASSWLLHSLLVTLLESSAPSFPTLLTLLFQSWTRRRVPPLWMLPRSWAWWVSNVGFLFCIQWLFERKFIKRPRRTTKLHSCISKQYKNIINISW